MKRMISKNTIFISLFSSSVLLFSVNLLSEKSRRFVSVIGTGDGNVTEPGRDSLAERIRGHADRFRERSPGTLAAHGARRTDFFAPFRDDFPETETTDGKHGLFCAERSLRERRALRTDENELKTKTE